VLVLVLDTSTPAVTAAVAEVTDAGVTTVAERVSVNGRAHGELLAPAIEAALVEAGAAPGRLSAVVAGVGPGPFTGLRVGLVTAAAFSQSLAIPAYGVCSLDAFAAGTTGSVLAATDARRREIYWAEYVHGVRTQGPVVGAPAAVHTGATRAVGDGALRYADVLRLPVGEPQYPPALALATLAADRVRERAPGERLTPLYLRRPDAAEPRDRKPVVR
jgi:tRNA threonylcarbamoyl adenosine modification protein YeaZ